VTSIRVFAVLLVGVFAACGSDARPVARPSTDTQPTFQKVFPTIPRALSPDEIAARIAAKRAFAKSYRPPPPSPTHWDFGLRTHGSQAPIASADLLPTSQWIGTNGHDVLEVYAGAYGRDHPNEGVILVLLHDVTSPHIRRGRLTPVPQATSLRIDGVDSYGRLRLTDTSGRRYALDATKDPPALTRAQTLDGRSPSASAAAASA
jgi:hypothetical protein